jgi:hypothetical protein
MSLPNEPLLYPLGPPASDPKNQIMRQLLYPLGPPASDPKNQIMRQLLYP